MVFEDAHWIDPTSREFLDLIVDRVRQLRVMLVITFRPEFQPPWAGRSHIMSHAPLPSLFTPADQHGRVLVVVSRQHYRTTVRPAQMLHAARRAELSIP
jgi:hypothetical protein